MTVKQEQSEKSLVAQLTSAVVRVHSQYLGRGPTRAQSFYRNNVVVVLMEDALTKAEQTLVANGKSDVVHGIRQEFQRAMRDDLIAAVEQLTGSAVIAFMSDNHVDPDMAAELFVLDAPVSGPLD